MYLNDSIYLINKVFSTIHIPYVIAQNNIMWLNLTTIVIFIGFMSVLIWFITKIFGAEINYTISRNINARNNIDNSAVLQAKRQNSRRYGKGIK